MTDRYHPADFLREKRPAAEARLDVFLRRSRMRGKTFEEIVAELREKDPEALLALIPPEEVHKQAEKVLQARREEMEAAGELPPKAE